MKKFCKVFLCLFVLLICYTSAYAVEIDLMESDRRFNYYYPLFVDAISKMEDVSDTNFPGRAHFNSENKNLIIGCSTVACMSMYAQSVVDNYKYDIVGFGGVKDEQILTWLRLINKKYNRIVFWGCANDIGLAVDDGRVLGTEYFSTLEDIYREVQKHLYKDSPMAEFVFVKIKYMIAGLDVLSEDYATHYNANAYLINSYADGKDFKTYEVLASTDSKNSEWYLHYNNPAVFMKMLEDIETIE